MSPRRRKAEDADVFAAVVRVMLRVGPAELMVPTPWLRANFAQKQTSRRWHG
jgi:hypothetical protein